MPRKKILVVDDSRTALMMTTTVLGKSAYDVVTAMDGEEAVRRAMADPPDLILLDIMMPKMDGFEACRKLRNEDSTRNIPIIMVTTRGEMPNVEIGYASGCSDYVTKPINSVELMAKVRNYIGD